MERKAWITYGVAFLVFAAAVLWAQEATGLAVAIFVGMAAIIALVAFRPVRTPKVLVVGDRSDVSASPVQHALAEAGFAVCRCDGPAARPCPVLIGKPCPLFDQRPVAAVIFRQYEATPLPPCSRGLYVPSLAAKENGRPADVVRTLEGLLAA